MLNFIIGAREIFHNTFTRKKSTSFLQKCFHYYLYNFIKREVLLL